MHKTLLFVGLMSSGNCFAQNYIDNYLSGTPTYTTIAGTANSVNAPRDLDFKPNTNELWVANYGSSGGGSMVIIFNAGQSNQTSQFRKDSHSDHFMIYPSGIAFGDFGQWACTNEIRNTASPSSTFMGPALWTGDTSIFARVFQNNWVNYLPLGSHLDMLHQSPFSMGIAHDSASVYWVFDGHNGNLCRYDFGTHHSPGYDDHSNGRVWRYTDVPLSRQPNVPGHMVEDKATGWLYIVDAGTKNLKRVNTNTGSVSGTLTVPSSGAELLASYNAVTGAQVQVLDSFNSSQPSGIDLYNGRLIVGDYGTGVITVYNVTGSVPVKLGTITTGQAGMMGLKIGTDGKIWFVNNTLSSVVRINPATIATNDAAIDRIISPLLNNTEADYYHPGFNQCTNSIAPVVGLMNTGSATLSSATISYRIDNGAASTHAWTGSLASGASASVTLPAISTTDGSHKLIVSVSNPNGTADGNPANNSKEGSFRSRVPVSGYPFSESFTSSTFPPTGWDYLGHNFHNEMSHNAGTGGYGTGAGSIAMDNYSDYEDVSGQLDYLMLPRVNMASANATASLSFDLAYAQYSLGTNDRLEVRASSDCGTTWTTLYSKAGASLSTAAPTTNPFIPTATQWRTDRVSLSGYAGQANVMLMFVSVSAHGNILYLDNVNIASGTGVKAISAHQLSVSPNPTSGKVSVTLRDMIGDVSIEVFDVVGRHITTFNSSQAAGRHELDLSGEANGVYYLRVTADGASYQQKVILNR